MTKKNSENWVVGHRADGQTDLQMTDTVDGEETWNPPVSPVGD